MATSDKTHLVQTALRLSPVFTSAVGATFSYSFGVFFAGFRPSTNTSAGAGISSMPAAAKWDAMPHWFRSVRARGLRTIFIAYNSSILLGGANALLFWGTSVSGTAAAAAATPAQQYSGWSRAAYAAGTLFSVAYYAYTFSLRLIPMNLVLADEKNPVPRREEAERDLARLDWRRTLTTGTPAAVSFFVAALLWFLEH